MKLFRTLAVPGALFVLFSWLSAMSVWHEAHRPALVKIHLSAVAPAAFVPVDAGCKRIYYKDLVYQPSHRPDPRVISITLIPSPVQNPCTDEWSDAV